MGRHKKIKPLQSQEKQEVVMEEKKEEILNEIDALEAMEQELDRKRIELEKVKVELEEKKNELKNVPFVPNREIDLEEKEIVAKQVTMTSEKAALKAKIEKQKAYDNQKVTGKFMNRRVPGQPVKLPYLKYEDDPVKWWYFEDGKTYTIPRGFADQINGGTDENPCYYMPKFKQKTSELIPSQTVGENSQISEVDTTHKKYAFVATSY